MKYSCYQDSPVIRSWFVYLVFRLRKATPRDSTKVIVEQAGFYSSVQERFLASLACFEELPSIQGLVSVSNYRIFFLDLVLW